MNVFPVQILKLLKLIWRYRIQAQPSMIVAPTVIRSGYKIRQTFDTVIALNKKPPDRQCRAVEFLIAAGSVFKP